MSLILSTNITSPLGMTTDDNYQAVLAGSSAIACHTDKWQLPEPFAASLFTEEQMQAMMVDGCTRFESLVIRSVSEALSHTSFDISSPRVVFILSTTKGNIELLADDDSNEREYPGIAAKHIARHLGITTEPIVVCNACISGVAAQILAHRLLSSNIYDYAIVAGGEVQGKFIVSGFQAFRAVTDEPCRPFDIERLGLNLGDGAATIILSRNQQATPSIPNLADVTIGSIRNDAYHLSAPHPQGDGYLNALRAVLPDNPSDIATIGVHGTATMYNDQMESKAIERAAISDIPLTSLKGYYGHTMGAAGIIETIITLRATADGIVLPARGFEEIGVSGKVNISPLQRTTDKHTVVKMLSGFGGCNAAIRYTVTAPPNLPQGERLLCDSYVEATNVTDIKATHIRPISDTLSQLATNVADIKATHTVTITPEAAYVNGKRLDTVSTGKALLKDLYKQHVNDYPKFYKMDTLTRLTFIATELLLKAEGAPRLADGATDASRAVILFNRSSSIVADRQYWQTIKDPDNYYPSPATFLYTLPNLTTGEVAIRNHYTGETSFYILPEKNPDIINTIIRTAFLDPATRSVITGWIDCTTDDIFQAEISLMHNS